METSVSSEVSVTLSSSENRSSSIPSETSASEYSTATSLEAPPGKLTGIFLMVVLFILVQFLSFLNLYLLSALPWCIGDRIFLILAELNDLNLVFLVAGVVIAVSLFLLDAQNWTGAIWRFLRFVLVSAVVLLLMSSALLLASKIPVAPVAVFLFGTPFIFIMLRTGTCFKRLDLLQFLFSMRVSLWTVSIVTFGLWMGWMVNHGAFWGTAETKLYFYIAVQCKALQFVNISANFDYENEREDYYYDENEEFIINGVNVLDPDLSEEQWEYFEFTLDKALRGCQSAFVLWSFPFILSAWAFIFGSMLFLVARAVKQNRMERRRNRVDPLAQGFMFFMGLAFLGLYGASSVAGAKMHLAIACLTLLFVGMVIAGIIAVAVFGLNDIKAGVSKTPLGSRLVAIFKSDWLRALLLILVTPLFALYLILNIFKQFSRRVFPCTKSLSDEEKQSIFTGNCRQFLKDMSKWNFTSILVKANWVGVIFFVFIVGIVRVTTLFMSYLNLILAPVSLPVTTVIFVAIGLTMFLLPPVPGVPVYVAGGVILVARAQTSMGFGLAVVYAIVVCFLLKLGAIALQQKVIGESMGSRRVWIRSAVGINSLEIRAIRRILQRKGMSLAKVCILCGGPDWPTSVLTGLIKMPLLPMLYGSLPVILLVAPTTFAGATLLKTKDDGPWKALSPFMLLLAMIAQGIAFLSAVHFIAREIVENEEELKNETPDEEVLHLQALQAEKAKIRQRISKWENLNILQKMFLILSALCMIASCYLFQLFGAKCFVPFSVNDTIKWKLRNNALNLVKPLGWIALGIFGFGCLNFFLYNRTIGWKCREAHAADCVKVMDPSEEGEDSTDAGVGKAA